MTVGQRRALVVLVVALCVVTALIWLPARQAGEEGAPQAAFADREPEDLTRIALSRGQDAALVLERSTEGWHITAPQETRADARRADALASTIALLQARPAMERANPADYGLDPQRALRVEISFEEGAGRTLLVGDPTPVGGGTYVQLDEEIRVAPGLLGASVDTTLEALRDRHLWLTTPSEATFVAVEHSGVRLEAVRSDDGWRDGSGRPLDSDGVDAWLRGLAGLRAVSFGPPPGPLAPRGHIELNAADGASEVASVGQVEGDAAAWWQGPAQAAPVLLDDGGLGPIEEGVRLLEASSEQAPPG
ncbi:MAG: DUF4340 domain-containing protein [Pseudomonadota bacterium]